MDATAYYQHKNFLQMAFNPNISIASKAKVRRYAEGLPDDADKSEIEELAKQATPDGYEFVKVEFQN